MKNKLFIITCFFITAIPVISFTPFSKDKIESINDKRIPEKIKQRLVEKKFTLEDNTLAGTYLTLVNEQDRPAVNYKYTYSFTMEDAALTGSIKLEKTYTGYSAEVSDFNVDIPKILECCKKPGDSEELCFKSSEKEKIKEAKNNGCSSWYKKIIP